MKTYLGDSVYAESDGFHIILYTDNGFGPENRIYLDDQVLENLELFKQKIFSKKEETNEF